MRLRAGAEGRGRRRDACADYGDKQVAEIERLRAENEKLQAKSLKIVRIKRKPFVIEDDR